MQILTKFAGNHNQVYRSVMKTLYEGTNLRAVKVVHRDERFLSLAQINKLYQELELILLNATLDQNCSIRKIQHS